MALIQCKMCGGSVDLPAGVTYAECPYCGSKTTFPKLSDDRKEALYNRAEQLRRQNDFDRALQTYEKLLEIDDDDPEIYWGLVLCRYGIEYVEDPLSHERIPTCHRVQRKSILQDCDYRSAVERASGYSLAYEKEAGRIAEIQKRILAISAQEQPFDIFICYKEITEGGTRTKDSVIAQDIYYQLTNEGYRVFFAKITLEDKLGQEYEPYIFAALNSAKVMLVIGSTKEHFEAVWVKNEWSRFLALMKKDPKKLLIPCYKDMDAYNIPEELSMLQSQDMSKIGFIQDILRGIRKIIPSKNITHQRSDSEGTSENEAVLEELFAFYDNKPDSEFEFMEKFSEIICSQYLQPGDAEDVRRALESILIGKKVNLDYLRNMLGINYNKAAEIIELFETFGIVRPKPTKGAKPRKIRIRNIFNAVKIPDDIEQQCPVFFQKIDNDDHFVRWLLASFVITEVDFVFFPEIFDIGEDEAERVAELLKSYDIINDLERIRRIWASDYSDDFDDDDDDFDDDDDDINVIIIKLLLKYRLGDGENVRRALEIILMEGKASTSYFQRRLGISFNEAADILDHFEARGIVGPRLTGDGKRDVLIFDDIIDETLEDLIKKECDELLAYEEFFPLIATNPIELKNYLELREYDNKKYQDVVITFANALNKYQEEENKIIEKIEESKKAFDRRVAARLKKCRPGIYNKCIGCFSILFWGGAAVGWLYCIDSVQEENVVLYLFWWIGNFVVLIGCLSFVIGGVFAMFFARPREKIIAERDDFNRYYNQHITDIDLTNKKQVDNFINVINNAFK